MSGVIGGYRPGPGIEQISRAGDSPRPQLPEGESPPPIDGALQLQLPAVLFQPSLDQALTRALEPAVSDRSILQPDRFSALVDTARQRLTDLADQVRDATVESRLREADRLLSQTQDLRDLLNSYRQMVQKV